MDEQQFKLLSDKMDTIIKLLALNAIQGKQLKEQVLTLSSFGFQPMQIAAMLGKTPNNVRVLLHRLRKEMDQLQEKEIPEQNQAGQTEGESDA